MVNKIRLPCLVAIKILLISLPLLWPSYVLAQDNRRIDRHFYFGECELPRDPLAGNGISDLWLMTCLNLDAGEEGIFYSGRPEKNVTLEYAHSYLGFHFTNWFSVHAKGRGIRFRPMNQEHEVEKFYLLQREYVFARIGNPVLNKYIFSVGEQPQPFGINYSELPEFYKLFQDTKFWRSPRHSMILSYDTQTNFFWDVGIATDFFHEKAENARLSDNDPAYDDELADEDGSQLDKIAEAVVMRAGTDISALDGSRLMASFYADTDGVRRGGLGFVTTSIKGDVTQLDWIRRFLSPDIRKYPFEQIVRFGYQGAWRKGTRWGVQVDDHRGKSRMGIVNHDMAFSRFSHIRIGAMLRRNLLPDAEYLDQWFVTSGLEVRL